MRDDGEEEMRHYVSIALDDLGEVADDAAVADGRWSAAFAEVWKEIDALVAYRLAALEARAVEAERERDEAMIFATEVREALGDDYAGEEAHWRVRSIASIQRVRGQRDGARKNVAWSESMRAEALIGFQAAESRALSAEAELAKLREKIRRDEEDEAGCVARDTREEEAVRAGTDAMLKEALGPTTFNHLWGPELEALGRMIDALTMAKNAAEAEARRLREALKGIAAEQYLLQIQHEDGVSDEDALDEWIRVALRYQAAARAALSDRGSER